MSHCVHCLTVYYSPLKETIEVLSVNTILFNYRRCSIWPQPITIHFVYCLIMSCRIPGRFPAYHGSLQLLLVFVPQDLVVSPLEWHFWQQMDCTWRANSLPSALTWPDTIGFRFLGVHENPGERDSRGDTRSCGTNTSSSWNHPCMPGIFLWHNQERHKI